MKHGFHPTDGLAHGPTPLRVFDAAGEAIGTPLHPELREALREQERQGYLKAYQATQPAARQLPKPVSAEDQSANLLRPRYLADMVGQDRMRAMLKRMVEMAAMNGRALDHVLLVAPAGTGKSTVALAIANELHTDCYRLEAPVSHDTLLDLREVCLPGDVVFIDEVHQQSAGDRRGRTSNNTPEVFLGVLEDRKLVSGEGILDFPMVTFIGATTDEGQLPDAFVSRFPIRPVFDPYTIDDLTTIAQSNAKALGVVFENVGAAMFACAGRLTPRVVNNYVRNAASICRWSLITDDDARTVLHDLNGVTDDGLTVDHQRLLKWLLDYGAKTTKAGTTYQASVATLATATGHGRDTKSMILRVEPWLLSCGLLRITSGGRALTDAGIARARQL